MSSGCMSATTIQYYYVVISPISNLVHQRANDIRIYCNWMYSEMASHTLSSFIRLGAFLKKKRKKKVIRLLFCNRVQFKQLNSKSYDNTNKHECVFDVLLYLFMPDRTLIVRAKNKSLKYTLHIKI